MPSCSKGDVVLVRYPFSDRSDFKVRPAVAVSTSHVSQDVFLVPLTSKIDSLLAGEFVLKDWKGAGLNIASAVKRGLLTIHQTLILKNIGKVSSEDAGELERSLRGWLGL
ncbi:MAG TPA: type II toxin-antitoxin system PemK/MazF family toxin [Pyrinomonadaceae bacterium]|nr:type II toxin-antitoxin system PemK/MazF family toxin [Pyrinomonadaceae bacterium]